MVPNASFPARSRWQTSPLRSAPAWPRRHLPARLTARSWIRASRSTRTASLPSSQPRTPTAWMSSGIRRRTCWPTQSRNCFPRRRSRSGRSSRTAFSTISRTSGRSRPKTSSPSKSGWQPSRRKTSPSRGESCRAMTPWRISRASARTTRPKSSAAFPRTKMCRCTPRGRSKTFAAARTCRARASSSTSS